MKEKNTILSKVEEILEYAISLFVIFVVISVILWIWQRDFSYSMPIDSEVFAHFGDFFGGVVGTLAAILGVYFVYKTYLGQQIESRFFELLQLHQTDVDVIYQKEGIDAFRAYISIVNSYVTKISSYYEEEGYPQDTRKVLKLAFLYMIYGTSFSSIKGGIDTSIRITDDELNQLTNYLRNEGMSYTGSYITLGIYFRQIYQTVKYIDKQNRFILSQEKKYEYIKMLRVRLNIEEQYLLFLNSLVKVGMVWSDDPQYGEGLITTYQMIKNIPSSFGQVLGVKIEEVYPDVEYEDGSMNRERDNQ